MNKQSREYQRERLKDPEYRAMLKAFEDPVYRARLTAQLKERLRDPYVRAKYNARRRKWYKENAESERLRLSHYRIPKPSRA
jgi:hypothetical protein